MLSLFQKSRGGIKAIKVFLMQKLIFLFWKCEFFGKCYIMQFFFLYFPVYDPEYIIVSEWKEEKKYWREDLCCEKYGWIKLRSSKLSFLLGWMVLIFEMC